MGYNISDVILIFIECTLLLIATISSSISISNEIHESFNPLIYSTASYLIIACSLLWISFILIMILLILVLIRNTQLFSIIYYIMFLIGVLVLFASIFSGISISLLQTIEPKDSHITSAYSASVITFISCLLFVIILIIVSVKFCDINCIIPLIESIEISEECDLM